MLDRQTLAELSQFRSAERPVISLYVRVDRNEPEDKHMIHFRNMVQEVEEQRDLLEPEQFQSVMDDMERARQWLRDHFVRGSESVAIFACGDELWQPLTIPYDLPTDLYLDDRPRLRPLHRLLQRYERYLAILSDARDAHVFLVTPEETRAIAQVEDDTPGRHDQGGWSQSRFQRHQDKLVEEHLANAAELAFRIFQRRGYDGVILLGTEERTNQLEDHLHPYIKQRVLARMPSEMTASAAEIGERTLEIARERRRERQSALLDQWENLLYSKGGQAVAGLQDTVQAAVQGQLLTLIMREDYQAEGGEDPQTGALLAKSDGVSDYSGAPVHPLDDVTEGLTALALDQGAELLFISTESEAIGKVDEYGGIGAILRYAPYQGAENGGDNS